MIHTRIEDGRAICVGCEALTAERNEARLKATIAEEQCRRLRAKLKRRGAVVRRLRDELRDWQNGGRR